MFLRRLSVLMALMVQLISFRAGASHGIGCDITYTCIGPNQYNIKLTLLRDCSGIPLSSTQSISISNSCGFSSPVSMTLNLVGFPLTFSNACSTAPTTCQGGTALGVQRYIFEGTVTLPGACQDWKFGHLVINRNYITTTSNGANDSMYVYSLINNMNSICNSSPVLYGQSLGVYYTDYASCYYPSAADPESDSLVFQMTTPRTGPDPGDSIIYLPGYSYLNPLQSSTPATFDPQTGNFCFTPSAQEATNFAILISEFRNGILIGQYLRDIQLRAFPDPVPNFSPVISGVNGTSNYAITACPGVPVEFFIASYDSNTTEDLSTRWVPSISGATFTTNTSIVSNYDTAYFSWTPDTSHTSPIPYCFDVIVHDNHCPITAVDTQQFCITVYPSSHPVCLQTEVDETYQDHQILVSPVPAHDYFQISTIDQPDTDVELHIYNIFGNMMYFEKQILKKDYLIYSATWPRGIYFIRMVQKGNVVCKKIVVN